MTTSAMQTVQQLYAAFGRGDIAAIAAAMADKFEWKFTGARAAPYTATVRTPQELMQWFGHVAATDDIRAFEPREFFDGGDHVTVLGWEDCFARATGKPYQCEWVHVFTLRDGKVTRFWGMYDTEAVARAMAGA
jgi:ketosteroid isomerase-like protein